MFPNMGGRGEGGKGRERRTARASESESESLDRVRASRAVAPQSARPRSLGRVVEGTVVP